MAYSYTNKKGVTYYLHKLKDRDLYYFSRKKEGAIDLPRGYKVVESKKTGLPLLKKA